MWQGGGSQPFCLQSSSVSSSTTIISHAFSLQRCQQLLVFKEFITLPENKFAAVTLVIKYSLHVKTEICEINVTVRILNIDLRLFSRTPTYKLQSLSLKFAADAWQYYN